MTAEPVAIDPPLEAFDGAVFDLDGVVTRTAKVHAKVWKTLFDAYLRDRAWRRGEPYRPFDIALDYRRYVDGKPRYEGVRSFLESRGIALPYGSAEDSPATETVCGLGNRKDALFRERLAREGVNVFESSVALIRTLRKRGLKIALLSSSKNADAVLAAASLTNLFDVRIDGAEAARLELRGKPWPDTFRHAADRLGVAPNRAFAVEDALAGVEAAKAAGFALVIGIDRNGNAAALRKHGADRVVSDLAALRLTEPPDALAKICRLQRRLIQALKSGAP